MGSECLRISLGLVKCVYIIAVSTTCFFLFCTWSDVFSVVIPSILNEPGLFIYVRLTIFQKCGSFWKLNLPLQREHYHGK